MSRTKISVDTSDGSFIVDKEEYEKFPSSYKTMFAKIMHELKDDERVQSIVFGYDNDLDGQTVMVYTNRCTLFKSNCVFEEDHSNDNAVVNEFLNKWFRLPQQESDKEQYEGLFKTIGKKIRFNRVWGGYRFSDYECEQLLEGNHIQFKSMSKSGEEKTYCGILAEQEYNNFKYFGFKLDGWPLKDEFLGYKFTENEKAMLLAGKQIRVNDLWSKKKQKTFGANLTYSFKNGIQMTF